MAHEFTIKDALAIIDAEIAEQDDLFDASNGHYSPPAIKARDNAHAARMALLNAKNAILIARIKTEAS